MCTSASACWRPEQFRRGRGPLPGVPQGLFLLQRLPLRVQEADGARSGVLRAGPRVRRAHELGRRGRRAARGGLGVCQTLSWKRSLLCLSALCLNPLSCFSHGLSLCPFFGALSICAWAQSVRVPLVVLGRPSTTSGTLLPQIPKSAAARRFLGFD